MAARRHRRGRGRERREAIRIPFSGPALAHLDSGAISLRLRDISTTGLFFYNPPEREQIEANVFLGFELPGQSGTVYARGQIVREDSYRRIQNGTAVQFTAISNGDLDKITGYITNRLQSSRAG